MLKAGAEPLAGGGLPVPAWREARPVQEGRAGVPWGRSPQVLQEAVREPRAEGVSQAKRRPLAPEAAAERTEAEPERWPCGARVG